MPDKGAFVVTDRKTLNEKSLEWHNPHRPPTQRGTEKRQKVLHVKHKNKRESYRPALSSPITMITMLNRTEKKNMRTRRNVRLNMKRLVVNTQRHTK